MFQRKLYTNYVFCVVYCVLCIVCCVSQYSVVPTIKCIFLQQNLMLFFKYCRFLNVCMQCSVDVIESVVELLRVWCCSAVIPLAALSRRSAGRWRP